MKITSNYIVQIRFILFFSLIFQGLQSSAQFSYGGLELSYKWINFDKGEDPPFSENNTRINELTATLNFIHRPIRRLGIGMSVNIPVIRGFKWSYDNAPTSDLNYYYYEDDKNSFGGSGIFEPYAYDYNVQNRLGVTLIGRLFFSEESSFYIDIRYTLSSINETFTFKRDAATGLTERNIDYNENHFARGPGFELGALSQFNDHFYFNYGFVMDFITYKIDPFSYSIEYSSNFSPGNYEKVNFSSQVPEKALSFMFHYGFGYRF